MASSDYGGICSTGPSVVRETWLVCIRIQLGEKKAKLQPHGPNYNQMVSSTTPRATGASKLGQISTGVSICNNLCTSLSRHMYLCMSFGNFNCIRKYTYMYTWLYI